MLAPSFHVKGLMGNFLLYVVFNGISVISRRWDGDNERPCATEPSLRLKRFASPGIDIGIARSAASA